MKKSFTEPDDSDIDRSYDWILAWSIQNELGAAAADVEGQHVGYAEGKPERMPNMVRLASSSPEISSTSKLASRFTRSRNS